MKATIISIVPRPVNVSMPGLIPSDYHIPAAKDMDFEVITINDSFFYVYRLEGEHIKVTEPGETLANSIVRTFIGDQLGRDEEAYPGLFWVSGELTKAEVKSKHEKDLARARTIQDNWFRNLVKLADDSWQKDKLLRAISEPQREACRRLKLNREWLADYVRAEMCPACGSALPNAEVTICATCQTIIKPKEHAAKFGTLVGAK